MSEIERIGDCIFYYNYLICIDGAIYDRNGKELIGCLRSGKNLYISLKINGEEKKLHKARLIYELFTDKPLTPSEIIRYNDGDYLNCAMSNLYVISRKEQAQKGYKSRFTKEEKEKIKKEHAEGISIRRLQRKYDCSLLTIQKALGYKPPRHKLPDSFAK